MTLGLWGLLELLYSLVHYQCAEEVCVLYKFGYPGAGDTAPLLKSCASVPAFNLS